MRTRTLIAVTFAVGGLTGAGLTAWAGSAGPATVTAHTDAPHRVAPSGKASIRHLARGQNAYVGWLEIDGGAGVPTHRDPTEEYIVVVEGEGRITIDGTAHAVKAPATIYMPANAEVSFQNGEARMKAVQVFAGPAPAKKYDGWKAPAAP
jgi:quercetin dioxygenase-like cupin family protein